MKKRSLLMAIAASLLWSMSGISVSGDKSAVQAFYDFLSNPASDEHAAAFKAASAENWESIGDYSGAKKNRDKFVGQLAGFGKLIPDLNWAIEEMIESDDRIIVRGRATGTPAGPLFGVDGQGKGFDIMSIDIHTLKDGKVIRTYHVEDWAGALRQLSAK